VERVELEQPHRALEDAGARTDVVSITSGEIQARDHDLEDAGTFGVDRLVGAAEVDDYDALLLPGGTVNPDELRMEPAAVQFVRDFVQSGKPVASICHGPWNFVEADVARGRRLTSWPSVRTDLRNAGAEVVDSSAATIRGENCPIASCTTSSVTVSAVLRPDDETVEGHGHVQPDHRRPGRTHLWCTS
jgi:protease I